MGNWKIENCRDFRNMLRICPPVAEMKIVNNYEKHLTVHSFLLCFTDKTLINSRFFTFYLISHENFEMKIRIPCISSRVSEKKTYDYVTFLSGEK